MAWRKLYLDLILVSLALLSTILYHCWLWYVIKTRPNRTTMGVNSYSQRAWVADLLKNNDKKNILAVQTLRNYIMGSTLVATSSVLIFCALLAFDSRATYGHGNGHYPTSTLGGHGVPLMAYNFAALLVFFLAVFVCHVLSIGFFNQVGILINIVTMDEPAVTKELVSKLFEKGLLLGTVGNRLFFATLPLTLWIFGPIIVFVCSIGMIPVLYSFDFIGKDMARKVGSKVARICDSDVTIEGL